LAAHLKLAGASHDSRPGLFYGGMVRRKNLLSTIMMSFAILCMVSVLWVLYGYTMAYAFVVSWLLAKALKATMGLRVKEEEESVGLDISQHGENAYGGM